VAARDGPRADRRDATGDDGEVSPYLTQELSRRARAGHGRIHVQDQHRLVALSGDANTNKSVKSKRASSPGNLSIAALKWLDIVAP
jgi:hypothetical protein